MDYLLIYSLLGSIILFVCETVGKKEVPLVLSDRIIMIIIWPYILYLISKELDLRL